MTTRQFPRPRQHPYWIIESATRGCFLEWRDDGKPRFQQAGPRYHSRLYYAYADAERELTRVSQHVRGCYLMEMGKDYAQRAYDTRGFAEVDENTMTRFVWKQRIGGKATQGPIYPLQWVIDRKIVAWEFFDQATKQQRRFIAEAARGAMP